jgi:hypothetical protein
VRDLDLNPDGPHSPERTREAGQLLDDASRFLAYASMEHQGGLDYPGDAYRLLADLYTVTGRLPQVCEQLERFLREQQATRPLYEARGRDVAAQVERAAAHLGRAADAAHALTRALQQAQSDIAGLGVKEDPDG